MTIEALRQIVADLHVSAGALAALGAALDARTGGAELPPALKPHIEDLVDGLAVALEDMSPAELAPVLAEIRSFMHQNARLLFPSTRTPGWNHTDPDILQAAGEVSVAIPRVLKKMIAPELDGLEARLDSPGAAFLDVGIGVAALSIEMARLWPLVRVVGIDPWAPSLALGRRNVEAAGLADRIELREQVVETLVDRDAFDLAWLPSIFLPERAIPAALEAVRRSLRRGGWLLFAVVRSGGDALAGPLARLRTAQFGGFVASSERVEALLRGAGFVAIRSLPSSPTAIATLMAARRQG